MSESRIIYTRPDGGVSIIVPSPGVTLVDMRKAIPADATNVTETTAAEIPADRTFRNAWEYDGAQGCCVHLGKAKDIAHEKRRAARAAEFAPLDVEATIPLFADQAETKRQGVRDKYAVMQAAIDAAVSVDELRAAAADVL